MSKRGWPLDDADGFIFVVQAIIPDDNSLRRTFRKSS